jgi:glycosyltransferase involved in cell wall biosynthesis
MPPDAEGKLPISAFIIAQDEADRIGRAIRSVRDWAAEVIVVDSGSSDGTQALARDLGAKVSENPWPGYGEQKRFAEDLCASQWLFNIDADEEVTPELAEEIRALFANGEPPLDGYRVYIADCFSFKEEPSPWANGHWQIRLYDRRKGRFSDSPVHDTVRPEAGAAIGKLKHWMAHRSHRNLSFAVEKMNRYTDAQVEDMAAKGRRVGRLRLLLEFPLAFFKAYLFRRNFLYGAWGWSHAITFAISRHLRIAKAYERQLMEEAKKKRKG